MKLPVASPLKPMLAKRIDALPDGDGWLYEPKWDGFRVILFRDRDEWRLQSRDLKALDRYFPELDTPIREHLPERCAVDGEVVVAGPNGLDFTALSMRIHPAVSRIATLSSEIPASLVLWDLLCLGDENLCELPFGERRQRLERALAGAAPPVHLTPATSDRAVAADWFARFEGAGLDGVMAKRIEDPYQPNKRAMFKIKPARTADCVLGGFRWHKNGPGTMVGSLLLGLYDHAGQLQHVGVAASFTTKRRRELLEELAPLRVADDADHPWREPPGDAPETPPGSTDERRLPGAPNRWSRGKNIAWEPLRPERVVEVSYDHMEGNRFRHTTHFVRWRPDKPAAACGFDQLEVTPPYELAQIFGARG